MWVRADYDDKARQLIHALKFEYKQAAAHPIAAMLAEAIPYVPRTTIITHIPTATSRVRLRGYDQSKLIAKQLAKILELEYRPLLLRVTQTRQVGSKRGERLRQMEHAFRTLPSDAREVLLVDDLTTTGASLEAAAKCLKKFGVRKVSAAVFAQKK